MNYGFEHQGNTFTPSGIVEGSSTKDHNQETERKELEFLQSHPERIFLYVSKVGEDGHWCLIQWTGKIISENILMGERKRIGFGFSSYRRSMSVWIFGTLYHGWYFESSGDYCRLKRAKHQGRRK